MAKVTLDVTNYVDGEGKIDTDFLTEIMEGLFTVTFGTPDNDFGQTVLTFTGRVNELAILIHNFESDPELRKELRDTIVYAPHY